MPIYLSLCESDLHFKNLIVDHIERTLNLDLIEYYCNGFELVNRLQYKQNNFLLIDAFTPIMTGIEALKILRAKHNKTPIIVYTQVYQEDLHLLFNTYDCVYYCQKNSHIIFKLLTALFHGNHAPHAQHIEQWKNYNSKEFTKDTLVAQPLLYTPSSIELQIINHACKGLTNNEIGKMVHLSGRTVETYIKKLTEKFHVKNKIQLITYCVEQHLHNYK